MTNEVLAILALMRTAWPGEWTDDQIRLWGIDLAKRDPQMAHAAVEKLRETSRFRPTLTEFISAYQQVRRREAQENAPAALPPGSSPVNSAAMFAGLRATFGTAPQHNHRHGADRCPVCSLHDVECHRRDRFGSRVTCPRCAELADVFLTAVSEYQGSA